MQQRFKRQVFICIMLLLMLVGAEIGAYGCCQLWKKFFAPQPTREEFRNGLQNQYEAENFDANLGWIPLKQDRDVNGARISPNNRASSSTCLSVYGDSFTFGADVSHVEAWPNRLAGMLNCNVGNFGVNGYGTDQAYLRFRRNFDDPSNLVLLVIQAENIVRNVNQNRAYLDDSGVGVGPLKPRFWLDHAGQMQLIQLPKLTIESYDQYINNPRNLFEKEFFIPDSSYYAKQRVHFPYIINLVNALLYKRIRDGLLFYVTKAPPWYQEFYDPSHPSHALQITESIVDQFVATAKAREKTPIVLFLPNWRDIAFFEQTSGLIYEGLYNWCQDRSYNCFDAGTAMMNKLSTKHINAEDICEYFCTGRFIHQVHYNEKGNKLLADVLLRYLKDYLPEAQVADGPSP